MTTAGAVTWDDLLEGEELAHVETVPSADARVAPLPDDLHPAVREILPFDGLYAHQRDAWDAAVAGEQAPAGLEHHVVAAGDGHLHVRTIHGHGAFERGLILAEEHVLRVVVKGVGRAGERRRGSEQKSGKQLFHAVL